MSTRTLGIEEELLVVDTSTWQVTSRARAVLKSHRDRHPDIRRDAEDLDPELFRHQVEVRTQPTTDLTELGAQVREARAVASDAASALGLAVAASGTAPCGLEEPQVSPGARYERIVQTFGEVARLGTTCGMHVHVEIESEEEGVACLDRIAPWLPTLLAMSTNSPYADGKDTEYASWRTQMWSSWPSAGPVEAFGDVAGYRRVGERMIATGAALDDGMLYWDARLSSQHPTLEVRVLDVMTDPEDAVLLAALVRALVETASVSWRCGEAPLDWRCEELRAARWRAARFGLSERLVDPRAWESRPAAEVVGSLRDLLRPRLEVNGDLDLVDRGLERVLAGTGAARQRAAFEREGTLGAVLADVVARTSNN